MEGKLPEIYWYVFWIGVVLISFGCAIWAGQGEHERRHKALDILKMYAERGAEPPAAMLEQLAQHAAGNQAGQKPFQGRGLLLQAFIGFLFSACVAGGLHGWLEAGDAENWMVFASQAAMAFFGFGAFGLLLAALLTRDR